jgi:hypothetical protein
MQADSRKPPSAHVTPHDLPVRGQPATSPRLISKVSGQRSACQITEIRGRGREQGMAMSELPWAGSTNQDQLGQKTTIIDCVSNRPLPCDLYSAPSLQAMRNAHLTYKQTERVLWGQNLKLDRKANLARSRAMTYGD